jgi:ubiquinone biosynthesis protein UbiJ
MLQRLHALVAPALATRLTLLLNHVLSAERVATERLVPHAGRTVALTLQGWPSLLPPPPRAGLAHHARRFARRSR